MYNHHVKIENQRRRKFSGRKTERAPKKKVSNKNQINYEMLVVDMNDFCYRLQAAMMMIHPRCNNNCEIEQTHQALHSGNRVAFWTKLQRLAVVRHSAGAVSPLLPNHPHTAFKNSIGVGPQNNGIFCFVFTKIGGSAVWLLPPTVTTGRPFEPYVALFALQTADDATCSASPVGDPVAAHAAMA